jgi:exonuclease VII large subunit
LAEHQARLDAIAPRIANLDPARLLARGWSITHTAEGRLVRGPLDATAGTALVTTTHDGLVFSTATGATATPTGTSAVATAAATTDRSENED